MENIVFHNTKAGKLLNFNEMIAELISYVHEKPDSEYRITVGSDSPGTKIPFFVTAVTILRVGNGGRYFRTRSEEIPCHTLQERIYKEVVQSITMTQELKSRLKDELGEDSFWDDKISIHIDVGKNGKTKDFIDGVVGMVRGYGFEAVIKPDSFCACVVADKHT